MPNSPTACNAHFHACHCVLEPHPAGTPHECVPDPVCGGSWLRVDTDDPGMVRIYRYPGNRPGCESYDANRDMSGGTDDPPAGEWHMEHDGIFRAPRGGITFFQPPSLPPEVVEAKREQNREFARAEEQRLLELMRSPDA